MSAIVLSVFTVNEEVEIAKSGTGVGVFWVAVNDGAVSRTWFEFKSLNTIKFGTPSSLASLEPFAFKSL
jgi:hypothetical protein